MERGPEILRFTVQGKPAGAGSKTAMPIRRGRGGPLVFREPPKIEDGKVWGSPMFNYVASSERTDPWMEKVAIEAKRAMGNRLPFDGPLWLDVFFYEHRPSTHYFHRKGGRVLRPDAPAYPDATEQHDVDKLRRAISDSLTNGYAIVDDKRVIGGEQWKDFVENREGLDCECAVIRLGRMDFATVAEAGIASPPPAGQEQLLAV